MDKSNRKMSVYIGNGMIATKNRSLGGYRPKDKKLFLQNALNVLFEITEAAEELGFEQVASASNIGEDTILKALGFMNNQFPEDKFPNLYGEALHSDEEDV